MNGNKRERKAKLMQIKQKLRSITASVLTFAMLLTLFPATAFAAVPSVDEGATYKNMFMHSAINHRPVSSYFYSNSENYFNTAVTLDSENPGC